jgi:predicted phosphodiesterase
MIALVSDLHGNELALDAVLADAEELGVDQIVCLGDVATLGPRPRQVLARLRSLGCLNIVGNHDSFMLDEALIHSYTEAPVVVEAVEWCRAQLSPEELAFIGSFVPTQRFELGGGATLLAYHGTPRSNMEDLLVSTPSERVDEMIAGHRATVMAGGHTHLQMIRQHHGTLIINPGSLGQPFVDHAARTAPRLMALAEYAIVGADARGAVEVRMRRLPLDRKALREQAASCDFPLRDFLVEQYR